ncbi:MAG TPA: ABC-F family ATP-binding cassette domain-containing protein [Herpetosiphonaceae bacterium]
MQLLSAEGLSKQYDDRVLFEGVGFGVEQGDRIGLIGVNGSGKSTLLKIVAGAEQPDRGQVTYRSGTRVAYLAQQPDMDDSLTVRDYMFAGEGERRHLLRDYDAVVARLRAAPDDPTALHQLSEISAQLDAMNAWDAYNEVEAILSRLGVSDMDQRLGTLSGGQRRRVALAHALIEPADLLILDEPTNHLDADTVDWLETVLARMSSALLLITHDRYVLDRLVRHTWELERGTLYQYEGGYSVFLQQKLERAAQRAADQERQTSIMRRELAWLRQGPQGRGTKQKARIERIKAMQAAPEDEAERSLDITLGTQRLGTRVLECQHVTKGYDGQTLFRDLTLEVGRGERLGIVGPNGSGKSTLLNLLTGRDQPDAGEIVRGETVHLAYYDQESQALDDTMRVIDYVTEAAALVRTSDGQIVSAADMLERFLFPPRMHYALIGTLSGGERRRLYLLRTLMFAPNVLLLDEPSNDLDVQTLAALESYLDSFTGTLLIASHDRYLLDRTVDHLLVFEGSGIVRTFPGSYSAYAADRRERPAQQPKPAERTPPRKPAREPRPRTLSFKERKELAALEERIAALEAQQAELNAQLSSGATPYDEMQRMAEALSAANTELEQAFERWAELAAIAESTG